MEIGSFGLINAVNLDDYLPSSASSAARSSLDFADLLERTRAANASSIPVAGNSSIDKTDRLYELCLELETFLIKNMLNSMRSTVQKTGLVDDSFAGKMYEDMLYEEYAKEYTKSANFGFAEQAYLQLKRL